MKMTLQQFFNRFNAFKAEGQTPGHTRCLKCGYRDWLVLNAEAVTGGNLVEMKCSGCRKTTLHDFYPK